MAQLHMCHELYLQNSCNIMYPIYMVCFRYITEYTLHILDNIIIIIIIIIVMLKTINLHDGDLDNPIPYFSRLLMTCEMVSAGTSTPSLWTVVWPNDHPTRHVHNQ
jgi:hypothetical protein